jgi:hypothetical protein|tara:strand:- start:14 stop:499 length:486 start_codon:yes stop_codon:yes gene_type:complete
MKSITISKSTIFAFLVCISLTACSSTAPADQSIIDDDSAAISVVLSDQNFTPGSFITAGWKKSKQYETTTVPESIEIWYGFFQQKDIEIRFYPSHEVALEYGVPAAEQSIEGAVKRSKGGKLLDVSGGSFTGYSDFLVAGNAVLLCEFDRTKCDLLVSALK